MAAAKSTAFDDDLFETRLESLKDTQEGIQQMSSWCLQQRAHHKKIVACWLNVFKKVRVEHRLVLFYLANDVIQYSKRKRYEFVESWATALQRATTMVRDEKVKGKILRIFNIWEQREIYSEEYLSDLSGLLNINPPKKTQTANAAAAETTSDDYQNATLIANIRDCVSLSTATDNSFKKLPKSPSCDIESIKQQLKDKSHSEDVENEIERYITYNEAYNKNLYAEIKSRKSVITYLDNAIKFYAVQRGEVKVVSGAYKHFGSRVKLVKKKLDEMIPNLPSPIPSPDINAPSPERDADLQLPDEQSPISINLFKNNINGYSSYLDGNLPFDINDFKRDESITSKASSQQPIEVIASRSDDENYNTGVVDYYKPESISSYTSGGGSNISIPGLNPMPVPPVRSEYTSLARAAQQYGGIIPPPAPPIFGGHPHNNNNLHHNYMSGGYSGDTNYASNSGMSGNGPNVPPLMPPPPIPSLNTSGGNGNGGGGGVPGGLARPHSNSSADFNSTWDMSMSWTSMDNSNVVDTPVSPPHFEREANSSTIEYSEHNNSMLATQDVDHRQLHLPPAFNIGMKLGLSKDKTRQLDIDHRNLISLTGSPRAHENNKKSWLSTQEKNFQTNNSGDVDYRTLQKIDTIPSSKSDTQESADIANNSPSGLMAPPGVSGANKKSNSPQKSNASSSSESQKEDAASGNRYDPTDMVVDMDMSDEDLDDIFREVNEENQTEVELQLSATNDDEAQSQESAGDVNANGERVDNGGRPALLETPHEYLQQNMWESQMNMSGGGVAEGGYGSPAAVMMDMQQQQQQHQLLVEQQQHAWNHQMQMPWNGGVGGGGPRGDCAPPPPRPPFPPFYQGGEYRGGGRGWAHSPHQYRNYSRPPRGGRGSSVGPGGMHHEGGSPYFNRGRGGGGPMRGPFRGKFRGNHSWI